MTDGITNTEKEMKTPDQQYEEYKIRQQDHQAANSDLRDRAILVLLSSGFGFSLLATGHIATVGKPISHAGWLYWGWMLLIVTIVLYLVNFWVADRALNIEIDCARKHFLEGNEQVPGYSKWSLYVGYANWATIGFLTSALACIVVFVVLNLEAT